MANVKISQLDAGSALGGTEVAPFVQSGDTVQITAAQIRTYAAATSMPLAGGTFTGIAQFTRNLAFTAAGTNQGNAEPIITQFVVATTVASGTGAILTTGARPVWIRNAGANNLTLYPPAGGQINAAGTNTGVIITPGSGVTVNSADGAQWYTF